MLMLQPPGRGSTYLYVLPRVAVCKHAIDVMPPIRGMRRGLQSVYVVHQKAEATFRFYVFLRTHIWRYLTARHLVDLPYGCRGASAMMSPP